MEKTQIEAPQLEFIIATATNRHSKKWKNHQVTLDWLRDMLSNTTRTKETMREYRSMSVDRKGEIKDVGGFVGGALKEGRRKAENLQNRTLLTLDLDNIAKMSADDVWDTVTMFFDAQCFMYSTHSHTPEKPRLRIVMPLSKPVMPDEYQAIARKIADDIGIDLFDDTTYEPSRLMYWPSTSKDGEFYFQEQTADPLDVDAVLARYPDGNWADWSYWPTSSRQDAKIETLKKKQEDPLEKHGVVGAFCRTYSISEAIDAFLPEVYIPVGSDASRYTFTEGSTAGGAVVYDDKFLFSHHGTDPVSGQLVNAFDLVRLHLFGGLDDDTHEKTNTTKLPSYKKMMGKAQSDENVKLTLGREGLANSVEDDFDFNEVDTNWLSKLSYTPKGVLETTIENAMLVLENHPKTAGKLIYNEFSNRMIVRDDLPWQDGKDRDWSDLDDAGARAFLEKEFGFSHASKTADAVSLVFERSRIHPVRYYLNSLVWDGVERVDTCLIDYLGADDIPDYTRVVSRKHLVGAVKRIFEPGCKYDTMVTLTGAQGIGKSSFIRILGKDWYSDSLDTVKGKEAYEQLQGHWLIEMPEMSATKKAEIEAVKMFLSKVDDVYRVAYGKRTSRFLRQCVFWGTTNDHDFLRDKTGDRRTWPVDCGSQTPTKKVFGDLAKEVDQLWAEAVHYYRQGEKVYLETPEQHAAATEQQRLHSEDTPMRGLIEAYLDMEYPEEWPSMDLFKRQNYIKGDKDAIGDDFSSGDTFRKEKTCVAEIWQELFKGDPKNLTPIQRREIGDILKSIPGWKQAPNPLHFDLNYGKQRAYIRK